MADHRQKEAPTTAEVSVNWEGLKRFLGWEGSIADLKQLELDRPDRAAIATEIKRASGN